MLMNVILIMEAVITFVVTVLAVMNALVNMAMILEVISLSALVSCVYFKCLFLH